MSSNGSGIDILIRENHLPLFHKALAESLVETNGAIVSVIESKICPMNCILGLSTDPWGLMIDLHLDKITYRNQKVVSGKSVLENTFL